MLEKIVASHDTFNQQAFSEALRSNASESKGQSELQLFKRTLKQGNEQLSHKFDENAPIYELLEERSWFIDQLVINAWKLKVITDQLALVAVGGYGREELYPGSDIDLMIIIPRRISPAIKSQIEAFLRFLWDIGLEIGQSVRTVNDCQREAKGDITIATNLMESRLLAGREDLYHEMKKVTGPAKVWPTRKFFECKLQEQVDRHKRYDDVEHDLEPNIKEGLGGLRDIQMIGWVAKRHFNASTLKELTSHHFLTKDEYTTLEEGYGFLARIRFALHLITGRREDRLLFDFQRKVAEKFGYVSEDNSAVEAFMKLYYSTVSELSLLNEMLLQHFQEVIIYAKRKEVIIPLNRRFQIRNDFIEARHANTFKNYPFAILELFLLKQQTPRIKGVRASTIRMIRESLYLINDDYRNDIRNKSLFMEIIRQPRLVGHELHRMLLYGVLPAYLPEFEAISGLMQFDLFHVYTVDEHILAVVRNLRRFTTEESAQDFPLAHNLMKSIPKPEILYLAGLFHDIAKGRGGNHSLLGVHDALNFCRNHGLSEFDSKLVAWLVEHHLLMAKTSQKEDISDPKIINRFAGIIGDEMHLNYLYLLTVADINGTNPKLWNSWKAALMIDLYKSTQKALRRGLENPIDKDERIAEIKVEAIKLLGDKIKSANEIYEIWAQFGDEYFIQHSADEISWHTRAIAKSSEDNLPLVLIREMTERGASEIFIYMKDHEYIFARATKTLGILNLNIMEAKIITSANAYTLDTFIVLEKDGSKITGRERKKKIESQLKENLTDFDRPIKTVSRFSSRKLAHFPIPMQISFTQDEINNRTIMEVIATDAAGFLSAVGTALATCKCNVLGAKIATYGERIEDVFFITDSQSHLIRDEAEHDKIRVAIKNALK